LSLAISSSILINNYLLGKIFHSESTIESV